MKLFNLFVIPVLLVTMANEPLQAGPVSEKTEQVKPANKLTYGRGIDLIVKGLGLNIDNIRFVKEPKATDYVAKADNKAAYANSIIIAACNGIKLSRGLNPVAAMTREQFALHLNEAIQSTGQYPVNMMWLLIKDEKSFGPDGLSAVQNLVKFNVVALEKGNFRPKALITASEATKMVKNAAAFIKSHQAGKPGQATEQDVSMDISPVNAAVNKISLSRGSKPNSGYQISISSIVFSKAEAIIHYQLTDPKAGNSYLQVITEPTAETFISSAYQVVLKKNP